MGDAIFFASTGQKSAQRFGFLSGLLAWPCEQCAKAQNDVAQHPEHKDHTDADGPTDRSSGLSRITGRSVELLADRPHVGHEPHNHQDIEGDQGPFENFAKEPSFGFSYWVPAMWAVKRFWGNVLATARTGGQLGHLKILQPVQFTRESSALHCGGGANARQGGSAAQIWGRRSPQLGRSPHSGAKTWDNVEGRRCAVSHEPSRNELGA